MPSWSRSGTSRSSVGWKAINGFYYGLDAIFFLTYGLFNEKPYGADILLNLPHVLISSAMLGVVYRVVPRFDPQPA